MKEGQGRAGGVKEKTGRKDEREGEKVMSCFYSSGSSVFVQTLSLSSADQRCGSKRPTLSSFSTVSL